MSIWTDHTPHSPFALPPLPPCLFLSLLCVCVCVRVCAVIEIFIFHLNCNNKTAEDICLNSRMAAGLNATAQQTSKHTHTHTHMHLKCQWHTHTNTHTRAHCAHKGNCQFVVSFCLSHSFCQFVRLPICQKFCVNYEPKSTRCKSPFVAHTHTHTDTHVYTLYPSPSSHTRCTFVFD